MPIKPNWIAMAAMAENRVIGNGPDIPWHLPEDFKWFKQKTLNHIIVLGRKTYESIGRPLPKRENIVITRQKLEVPGVTVMQDLASLDTLETNKTIFICGGAEIYRQALPQCSELFLTHVNGTFEGDILFPAFESDFSQKETVKQTDDFTVVHYRR